MKKNRRQFILENAMGSALLMGGAPIGLSQTLENEAPHFFLQFIMFGGPDATNLFDARPLKMTDKGLVQNYLYQQQGQDAEPRRYEGTNGGVTLRTPLTDPLMKFKDNFSIVNGVRMNIEFNGHEQNLFKLVSAIITPGGSHFAPAIGMTQNFPLESMLLKDENNNLSFRASNFDLSAELAPSSLAQIKAYLNSRQFDPVKNILDRVMMERVSKQGNPDGGLFTSSAFKMAEALKQVPELTQRFRSLQDPSDNQSGFTSAAPSFGQTSIDSAVNLFQAGVTSSVSIMVDYSSITDTHDPNLASQQPQNYVQLVNDITYLFEKLTNTPYKSIPGASLADLTTIMVSGEFSRTMRQSDRTISATGTDHNQFNNSFLIGGKGIKGGQVIGMSDCNDCDENGSFLFNDYNGTKSALSDEHKRLDGEVLNVIGVPFDFASGRANPNATESINSMNVVNTVLESFGVPNEHRQKTRLTSKDLPKVIKELLR